MRKFYHIIIVALMFAGCDAPTECFKTSGEGTTVALQAQPFTALEVNADFKVVVKQGHTQQVLLRTGENLISGFDFEVIDGRFIIWNNNTCNWTRSYELPVLTITHPDLREIRQGGSGLILSEEVLNYSSLYLVSTDQSGDFKLKLNCDKLTISGNDLSNFYISGESKFLKVGFYSGDGRFEGDNLKVNTAEIFHRGSNDMTVYVTGALTGRILSTGNVIYVKTQPAVTDISLENIGQLIDRTE